MDNKPAQNIQDAFLNNARRDKSAITIYLLSGVKLSGRIKSFDKYSVVLDTANNQEQLIFKHAISTVVTSRATQAHGERAPGGERTTSGGEHTSGGATANQGTSVAQPAATVNSSPE